VLVPDTQIVTVVKARFLSNLFDGKPPGPGSTTSWAVFGVVLGAPLDPPLVLLLVAPLPLPVPPQPITNVIAGIANKSISLLIFIT
jgi:hypothetical protein